MMERRRRLKEKHGNGNGFGLTLGQHVATLQASQSPSGQSSGEATPPTSLNPAWVEWLMGFPIGWTDLEGSATPSSPPSPSGSASG